MSPRAAIRATGAWWFLPVMFALGSVFPLVNDVVLTGYDVADLSSAGIGLAYNGPLLAAVTAYAWRGWAPFHRPLRSVRSGSAVLLRDGWPLLLGGPVVGCLAVVVSARAVPGDVASWSLLLTFFGVLVGCAAVGVALSWALPVVLAVPLSAAVCFGWINYLPATDSARLHHLTPTIDGFATTSQPAGSALLAVALISATVVVGLVVLVAPRAWDRTPRPLAAALVTVVLAGAAGLGWASVSWSPRPPNLLAAEPRATPLSCQQHGSVEVCLWPEGEDRSAEVAVTAERVNDQLAAWGLERITVVSAGSAADGATDVDATVGTTPDQLVSSLAQGYVHQRRGCEVALGREAETLVVVLTMAVVADPGRLDQEFSDTALTAAEEVLTLPADEVGAWFEAGLTDLRCETTR